MTEMMCEMNVVGQQLVGFLQRSESHLFHDAILIISVNMENVLEYTRWFWRLTVNI